MERKFLFLDCDGVMATMNSYNKMRSDGNCDFDPRAVEALNIVIEKVPELEIVISSTWRWGETIESFQTILDVRGVVNAKVVGLTPRIKLIKTSGNLISAPRGCEIQEWLNDFYVTDRPYHPDMTMKEEYEWRKANPYYYLILDDDSDMLYYHRKNFIKTNGKTGFKEVNKAIRILNTPVIN